MANDPAFLFYSSDFLSGVADLTMEERGIYITLLCLQHQKGRLTEKMMRLCHGIIPADVMQKFSRDENGLYFNPRLEAEIEKRKQYAEKQRKRAKDGWIKRSRGNAVAMPLENENENEIINEKENEVKSKKRKTEKHEIEMPFGEKFLRAWDGWKEYKEQEFKFRFKSPHSEQASLNELVNLSKGHEQTAIAIIEQSMSKGWKGFFELKTPINGSANHHQQRRNQPVTGDDLMQAHARMFGDRGHVEPVQHG